MKSSQYNLKIRIISAVVSCVFFFTTILWTAPPAAPARSASLRKVWNAEIGELTFNGFLTLLSTLSKLGSSGANLIFGMLEKKLITKEEALSYLSPIVEDGLQRAGNYSYPLGGSYNLSSSIIVNMLYKEIITEKDDPLLNSILKKLYEKNDIEGVPKFPGISAISGH